MSSPVGIYRASFDRPRGTTPEVYSALVKLEGEPLEISDVQAACLVFELSARLYERSSGRLCAYVYSDGTFTHV